MTTIIGAPTLDDALTALKGFVRRREERGEKTLIFCEDRLTLLTERAVLDALGGTFLCEVTTFARFLSGPRVLSKEGSVMEVSSLIEENAEKLVCFRARSARAVYETLAQLSASRVTEELLLAGAEETEGLLSGKLRDLALLLGAYSARLREKGLLDESGYLALLPEKLSDPSLKSTHILFFGFHSFTRQALEGVRSALLTAASVTGIFLSGEEELYTCEGELLFRRVCEETETPRVFRAACSLEGEARALLGGLFSPERAKKTPLPARRVRRFTADDEAEEFSVVAALIKMHVLGGMRYRDIAVLVGGKESIPAVRKAFSAYRIPFFADYRRSFSEHPFCALLLALLSAVADGCLADEADAIAANYYFGGGSEYRNYLLKYGGYRGAVRREIRADAKGFRTQELAVCRERMLSLLKVFPRKGTGREYAEGVRRLLLLCDAEKRTEELREHFTGSEREFLSLEPLEGVLAELEAIAGERVFGAREMEESLRSGLSALEISMIPQYADAVFVGDATDSRLTRVRVLFATGLTGELPRVCNDTAVITDREMGRLGELKVEIEPAIAQVNARARESLALNLCSFTDALYLSYPLSKGGAECGRSEILQYAEAIFSMPPMPDLFPYNCAEEAPAALTLLALKEGFETGREEDGKRYSALYRFLGGDALLPKEKGKVPEAAQLFFAGDASPTLLEGYFACPYASFATRGLRLREREERTVLATDAGTFLHAVLEETAKSFNDLKSEEECRALAAETGRRLLSARFAALLDTDAGAYTAERLVGEGADVAAAAFRQLFLSAFRVKDTESAISLPELSLSGKTDRVDAAEDLIRVIDYKTGEIDDSPTAYYTGRRIQLELYLKAASEGGRAAGAFYFPASSAFTREGAAKFGMSGFFCDDDEVTSRMDPEQQEGQKSLLYNGGKGVRSSAGLPREEFEDFLSYSVLVSRKAEREMKEGNVAPSPFEGACRYCKLRSLCGFSGEPRKESGIDCKEIAAIVRRERGDE